MKDRLNRKDLLHCLSNHRTNHRTIQARHDESQREARLPSVGHDHRDGYHGTKAVGHHGPLQPHPAKEKAENHGQSAAKDEELMGRIVSGLWKLQAPEKFREPPANPAEPRLAGPLRFLQHLHALNGTRGDGDGGQGEAQNGPGERKRAHRRGELLLQVLHGPLQILQDIFIQCHLRGGRQGRQGLGRVGAHVHQRRELLLDLHQLLLRERSPQT
mmetsp:Transcript_14907/g.25341  ORF Transcript_14907/g.25341 Transcript_14907/m.25341 type:complete len:215 (-) Transcript_14907:820-1464(-)